LPLDLRGGLSCRLLQFANHQFEFLPSAFRCAMSSIRTGNCTREQFAILMRNARKFMQYHGRWIQIQEPVPTIRSPVLQEEYRAGIDIDPPDEQHFQVVDDEGRWVVEQLFPEI